ncbi:dolichol-phosphate mannosyltransferase [Streptomyces sp. TLI_053]|uniref:glycosyltransferase family 2 protein n=1 Tax=Streptomyces sp. TLI_053 TaxID=1855352 RepID=UPI00087AD773|nr:glycosyltransferase family 2 protein [Streptomyces sp. TLI_053]SDT43479.1 dolichol-phosphate mannosyltransferase [Streptomyces sp. TLI_053]
MSENNAGPVPGPRYLISVVVPCFNEEAVLPATYERLTAVMSRPVGPDHEPPDHELVFVDDGSTDRTWEVLRELAADDPRVHLVRFSRNFGHQCGLLAGLREAAGDAVVMIDADLQDPPEVVPELVERWRQGWPVVSARRTRRQGESWFKRGSAYAFYRTLDLLADQPVARDTGDFRLLDRSVVDLIATLPERRLFLRGQISWAGFPETTVEYVRRPRSAGRSKYGIGRQLALAHQALMSCSAVPARLPVLASAAVLGAAAAGALTGRAAPRGTWALGVQLLCLGVLADYVFQEYDQTRGRPVYLVRQTVPGRSAARTERMERMERTERTEWTERTDGTERTERTGGTERTVRTARTERPERAGWTTRAAAS